MADTDVQVRVETCRIELWRGYVSASFVARSTEGEGEAVSEPSKSFRWRSSSAPDTQHAKLAHYLLLMRLKHEGWSESGEGDEWYDVELARPIAVPLNDEPEPEPLPEVVHVEPEPLPPPLPATVMSNVVPLPVTETERARDPWRVTAAIGLAVALLFLLVLLRT